MIRRNQEQFGDSKRNFIHGSLTEPLPPADMLVINNVLQHLTNDRILKFIVTNILPANETTKCLFKYALITNDQCAPSEAGAIHTGGYGAVDLSKDPFQLPVVTFYKYNLTDYCKVAQLLELKKLGCKQYVNEGRHMKNFKHDI